MPVGGWRIPISWFGCSTRGSVARMGALRPVSFTYGILSPIARACKIINAGLTKCLQATVLWQSGACPAFARKSNGRCPSGDCCAALTRTGDVENRVLGDPGAPKDFRSEVLDAKLFNAQPGALQPREEIALAV